MIPHNGEYSQIRTQPLPIWMIEKRLFHPFHLSHLSPGERHVLSLAREILLVREEEPLVLVLSSWRPKIMIYYQNKVLHPLYT
jgi:hypothetical protein